MQQIEVASRLVVSKPVPISSCGHFGRLPLAISQRPEVSDRVKILILVLTFYMNDWDDLRKGATVFQSVLATAMGRSIKTVQRALREAEAAGLIKVHRGGPHQQNTYILLCLIDLSNETARGSNETPRGSNETVNGDSSPRRNDRAVGPQATVLSPPPATPVATQATQVSPLLEAEILEEEDLSNRRRDASGARRNQQRDGDTDERRGLVVAELISEGFPAEEIQGGLEHPDLYGPPTVKSVKWAITNLRLQGSKAHDAKRNPLERGPVLMTADSVGCSADQEVETQINRILEIETERRWRDRLVGACGAQNRRAALLSWQKAHNS